MKIYKLAIIILLIALTSCEKDSILPVSKDLSINNPLKKEWLNIPGGFASFLQFDYNNDGVDDVVTFDGYDLSITYMWPGPQFYKGNSLIKDYPEIDNKKIFGSKLIGADFDNNGYKDIFVMSGMDPAGTDCLNCDPILPNNIMFNINGKSFKVKELSEWKGIWRSASVGDIDKDGDIDLLIFTTHQGKGLYNKLLINDGSGNFIVRKSDIDYIEWVDAAEMFDINNDGFLDLVINDIISTGNRFRILWGNGDNFYQTNSTTINVPNNMWVLDIDAFDFDKDNNLELIISMNYPSGEWNLNMFKSIDNKTYINITNEISDNVVNKTAYGGDLINIADIDGNGKMDVYSTHKSYGVRWEFDKILIRK